MTLTLEEPLTTKKCSCCNKVKKVEEFINMVYDIENKGIGLGALNAIKNNLDRDKDKFKGTL